MLKSILAALSLLAGLVAPAWGDTKIAYVPQFPPARHPQIVYWFWQSNTLANAQYLRDVEHMAADSPFNFAFMTERGVDFYDYGRMHDVFAQTVRAAHAKHIKIGLQLWEFWSGMRVDDATFQQRPVLPVEQALALVTEGETVLDASGHADYSVTPNGARDRKPFCSKVLRVFAFRPTADGFYAPESLQELSSNNWKIVSADAASVTLAIDAPAKLAGSTVSVFIAHYYNYPDLFNSVMAETFRDVLKHYADIPFDGTALDEYGYLMVTTKFEKLFRERFYGRAFASEFQERTGDSLERTLFDMSFAPDGRPEVRMRAINNYFDVLRDGSLRGEKDFYQMSKAIFGTNTLAGVHNTFHNHLTSDDIWRTGLNYWTIPREYGQSDEDWPAPDRMGVLVSHREPVMFDQYYAGDVNAFLKKAFRDARFGGRIHYHAWNDTGRWGKNIADAGVLAAIKPAEEKIRLLNQFDPAAPKLPGLIIFGMPAQINWYPDATARSTWDINGSLGIEQKAQAIWKAGYPCALVPSDLIDSGQLTLDGENHPGLNGHRFECVVFLYPQYAKETTLAFLENYTRGGGQLMLEGNATHDFSGCDIAGRFEKIATRATVRGFDVKQLAKLGVQPNPLSDGAFMEDGAVVFADYASWRTNQAKPFKVNLGGHEFSGSYVGVCALKAGQNGELEKFVCGGFTELQRDGRRIFSLPQPADVLIRRGSDGDYQIVAVNLTGDARLQVPDKNADAKK